RRLRLAEDASSARSMDQVADRLDLLLRRDDALVDEVLEAAEVRPILLSDVRLNDDVGLLELERVETRAGDRLDAQEDVEPAAELLERLEAARDIDRDRHRRLEQGLRRAHWNRADHAGIGEETPLMLDRGKEPG